MQNPVRFSALVGPSGQGRSWSSSPPSGTRRRHAFCPNCGSPIYATSDEDNPSVFGLRVGALDQRAQLAPKRRIWCRSALPWSQDLGGLPTLEKG